MGGRFSSLDQTHSECQSSFNGNYAIPSRNRVKTKTKKNLKKSSKIAVFSPISREDPRKKKVFTAIWDYIRPEFVRFVRADRPFSSDHPALRSRWGDANSRWGDASPRVYPTI